MRAKECAKIVYENYPNIGVFISVGLAGALLDQLKIGDIVIGNLLINKEQDKYETIKYANKIILPITENNNITYGPILCSDEFIHDTKKKQYLFNEYGALCVEMESKGIADFAKEKDSFFYVIKSISDHANEEATRFFIRSFSTACKSLARYFESIIDNLLRE